MAKWRENMKTNIKSISVILGLILTAVPVVAAAEKESRLNDVQAFILRAKEKEEIARTISEAFLRGNAMNEELTKTLGDLSDEFIRVMKERNDRGENITKRATDENWSSQELVSSLLESEREFNRNIIEIKRKEMSAISRFLKKNGALNSKVAADMKELGSNLDTIKSNMVK